MAEMTDFYRTLSDLAGIDPTTIDKGVEGDSLAGTLAEPSGPGKAFSFSQTNRVAVSALLREPTPRGLPNLFRGVDASAVQFYDPSGYSYDADLQWMGYTVRSKSWRFTEWLRWRGGCASNDTEAGLVELYSHASDTTPLDLDASEYNNLAHANPDVVAEMRAILRARIDFGCQPTPPPTCPGSKWCPPPPPPPMPPPPARDCPSGFAAHASGLWQNCVHGPGPNCGRDRTNTSVASCGAKCASIAECRAFEVFEVGLPADACWTYLHELELPFVPNSRAATCVKE